MGTSSTTSDTSETSPIISTISVTMYKYQSTLLALRCPATSERGNNNYVIILRHYFVIRSQSNAVKLCTNIRTKLQFASLAMMENILLQVIMVSFLINLQK